MKKILSLLLAMLMVLSMAACGSQPAAETPNAILRRIDVARDDLAHGNPVKLDLHFFVLLLNHVPRNDFTR